MHFGTRLFRTNTLYFSEATRGDWSIKVTPSVSVPEPSSILLVLFGLSTLCLRPFQR
ncbi:PEP-CTERM sorting domain-containing protein [Cellvibrio sp. KY-GH-1]|uniref:PEP-CTERM sorting domain-containing protein n=1 Tax=Cellvibrio sp. KY-GH-1 TaxID=2303332 RepID=UPI001248E9D6|nr:PEP-CTERM sorting domain-containing protein [Cellvibrio sp. KY-GH-1]